MHGPTHHEPIVPAGKCRSARLYQPGRAWWIKIKGFRLHRLGVRRRCPHHPLYPHHLRQCRHHPNLRRTQRQREKIRMASRIPTRFSRVKMGPRHIHIQMGGPSINILRVQLAQGRTVQTFVRIQTIGKVIQFGDHQRAALTYRMVVLITVSLFTHLRRCQRLSH